MLSVAAVVLAGAAAATQPIEGAFGVQFGAPLPPTRLGASLASSPYPTPPDNLDQSEVPRVPGRHGGWFYLEPAVRPEVFERNTRFLALLTNGTRPVRLLAERTGAGCEADFEWLLESLVRKYAIEGDPVIEPRAPFARAARIRWEDRQVDLSCGRDVLLLEYTSATALGRWRADHEQASQAFASARLKRQEVEERVRRAEHSLFADTFTYGERFRLDGGLGVTFGTPYPTSVPHEPDTPFDVTLTGIPEPFASGRYQLTLGPDELPIKLSGEIPDPDGRLFQRLSDAVRAKYGSPMKDAARHKIFRINGNYLILRALPRMGEAQLAFIDAKAQRAQEARARAAEIAAREAEEAEFRQKTKGL